MILITFSPYVPFIVDEIQKVPALLNEVHKMIEEKKTDLSCGDAQIGRGVRLGIYQIILRGRHLYF